MKIIVKLLPLLLLSFSLQAQTDDHDHDHDHDHDDHSHHEHDHHANELGLAHLFVYFPGEKETAYGLHFHYLHYFADARYGIGLGTEYVFEHKHLNYGIVLSARPYKKFVLSISPGIAT